MTNESYINPSIVRSVFRRARPSLILWLWGYRYRCLCGDTPSFRRGLPSGARSCSGALTTRVSTPYPCILRPEAAPKPSPARPYRSVWAVSSHYDDARPSPLGLVAATLEPLHSGFCLKCSSAGKGHVHKKQCSQRRETLSSGLSVECPGSKGTTV